MTPDILEHVGGEPIARKVHWVSEVDQLSRGERFEGIVLIRRDPVEAILASIRQRKRDAFGIRTRRDIRRCVQRYFDLLALAEEAQVPCLHLTYEAMTSDNPGDFLPALEQLIEFLADGVDATRADTARQDFRKLQDISATGNRRSWDGIRSNGDPAYHQKRLGERWADVVRAEIARHRPARSGVVLAA